MLTTWKYCKTDVPDLSNHEWIQYKQAYIEGQSATLIEILKEACGNATGLRG